MKNIITCFRYCTLPVLLLTFYSAFAQTTASKLQKAFQQFEDDTQLKFATSSLYVIDAKTGKVVFEKNARVGLAPASTQKIITSVTAFELLGKAFRYQTNIVYRGELKNGVLNGDILIQPSGDPTLASWRYDGRKEKDVLDRWIAAIKAQGIKSVIGEIIVAPVDGWSKQFVPEGWIWQDMGNYYGAGAASINWHENQYDMILRSGSKAGDSTGIVRLEPALPGIQWTNELKTGVKGSGDNAYIFLAPYASNGTITGTIPPNENAFKISGSVPDPVALAAAGLRREMIQQGISVSSADRQRPSVFDTKSIDRYNSPALDSIIYWFNKKSINLYGEALIKTMAYRSTKIASTDSGVVVIQDFWKQRGIDVNELNISDGSGLSPLNRVTTHAQVEILRYAKSKDWFASFYDALPEYNGMKMKSGTIRDAKGFCGYQKAADGNEYIFSFLVNNYNGSSGSLVNKMYKVLDNLK